MALTADQVLARYKAGMSGGSAKYAQGIQAVTVNPMALAAARVADGTWAQRTTAAAPKLLAKLNATSQQTWQAAASSYGASNFAASATKAGANYGKVVANIVSAGAAAKAAAAALPPGDSVGRFTAAMAATKAAWGKS